MKTFPLGLIFDLNGTMVNDMEYHIDAWSGILNKDLNAGLTREAVKSHMYGKNSELLIRVFGEHRFTAEEMEHWSVEKEKRYQKAFLPELKLIPGLEAFLEKSFELKIPMAIGSAAIPFNIDFVLDHLHIRKYFSAIVSAEDVAISKPHPETFLKAAALLHTDPSECLLFEDSPKGVEAGLLAGMPAVVLTTMHNRGEFSRYPNILHFIADYGDPYIIRLTEGS
ncbi:MAG: HAD family phosphatase [Bacteroidota bacterium]|nr:HAD family phosphatase [Bacteroidota bacterium]